VGRDAHLVQRAVVFVSAVVSALVDGALDAVVCTFLFHDTLSSVSIAALGAVIIFLKTRSFIRFSLEI